ncbi:DNA-directed RNA polymerase I subunit RPA49-like isoform X2 [Limulus polyphemus]|uniref:DNA-directed RNA polymerase I subunit RPA49-like isoform X2 n=1 Tax=Limulus polyphemus TaxID=6850 RepID=A0ABM1BJH1_LIMPO|nr:DNA-directed RNA polymerase I subunit RPA49-like isoform X2 [Limulus polyphemus]
MITNNHSIEKISGGNLVKDHEKCKLEYIGGSDRSSGAYLVNFSNGKLKQNTKLNLHFKSYESSETREGLVLRRKRKIMVADSGRLQYVGYNFGSELSHLGTACRYCIGLLDKNNGTMKVYSTQMFHMRPSLEDAGGFEETENPTEKSKSYTEKVDMLTSAFGSKRKRKAMESRVHHKVEEGNLELAADKVVENIDKEVSGIKTMKKNRLELEMPEAIPPQNRNATCPEEVYNVKDIISIEEYSGLDEEANLVADATLDQINEWKKEEKYCHYVLIHLGRLSCIRETKLHQCKLLIYFHYLVTLLKLRYQDMKKKDPLPTVPEPYKHHLLNNFTLKSENEHGTTFRSFPQRMKDKVIAYAMVVALLLDGFSVDFSDVHPDLKFPMNRLITIVLVLGCHVRSSKNPSTGTPTKIADLTIPLYTPGDKPRSRRT